MIKYNFGWSALLPVVPGWRLVPSGWTLAVSGLKLEAVDRYLPGIGFLALEFDHFPQPMVIFW